ncbi:unnamed protein product [Brassicogethes aeneus]|uniref:Uncharacterized protein n=1 Tax=Brassicogethes aeneus TaxID=1431903 RepID=A0A9P0BGU3_BRAAE|nr:unnamed protein product [Brassicogethes aeneus]
MRHIIVVMHDTYLGVCRYAMSVIIKHLINSEYFILARLNSRLKYFDYVNIDRGNKINFINEKHIRDGCLITTAGEMSPLIAYFGIIIGDLVTEDDPVWELYLILHDIIDLIKLNF